jgi:DNA N-6-adenine-methyltransferase (Dam)
MVVSRVLLSKGKNPDWNTPTKLWNELNEEFDIVLDACTSIDNPLGTELLYSIDKGQDGLKLPWYNVTYCNPPYGRDHRVDLWLKKARIEQHNGVTSVLLLPSRTGTSYFHNYIYMKANVEIRFLRGRLRFDGATNSAPFDSMIIVFHGEVGS